MIGILLTCVVLGAPPSNKIAAGSKEEALAAANSLGFIVGSPIHCLSAVADARGDKNTNIAALWLRASFHDAGTWNGNKGGADGSLVHFQNVAENNGFGKTLANTFQANSKVNMSNADLIALGGLVTVGRCGGPNIPFSSGRVDAIVPTSPIGLLPNGTQSLEETRQIFNRMGWTNEDIVALVTGSHSMGGVHGSVSPDITKKEFIPFDDTAGIFDNHIFKYSLKGLCAVKIDCDIAKDPTLRPIVQKYADDQQAFFDQYKISFAKMIGQTKSTLTEPHDLGIVSYKDFCAVKQPTVDFEDKSISAPKIINECNSGASGPSSLFLVTLIIILMA